MTSPDPVLDERFRAAMAGAVPVVTPGFARRFPHAMLLVENDGRVSWMNDRAASMFGGDDAKAFLDVPWWTLAPEAARPAIRTYVTRAGLGETVTAALEGADGCAWDLTLTPVRARRGAVLRLLAMLRAAPSV